MFALTSVDQWQWAAIVVIGVLAVLPWARRR